MKNCFMIICLLSFLIMGDSAVYAALETHSYQYYREVQVKEAGFAFISLDSRVLQNTRDDLADLRLSTLEGKEISYQFYPYPVQKEVSIIANIIDKKMTGNEFSFTLDLLQTGYLHNKVSLDLESKKDFIHDVVIESSNDNLNWSFIARDKIAVVNGNYRKTDVNYPTSSAQYLRLRMEQAAEDRIDIKAAGAGLNREDNYVFPEIPVEITSREEEQEGARSVLYIDLGVKNYYIKSIQFKPLGRNYQREVLVYTSNDRNRWQGVIASGMLYHFQWSDYEAVRDNLSIDNNADRYIKIEINNGSSPPLEIEDLAVFGEAPRLLADFEPGTYQLWYGNSQAVKPQYDLAGFSYLIDTSALSTLKLGMENTNPEYQPPLLPWSERNRWVLNLAIVIAGLILGTLIVRNMSRGQEK